MNHTVNTNQTNTTANPPQQLNYEIDGVKMKMSPSMAQCYPGLAEKLIAIMKQFESN